MTTAARHEVPLSAEEAQDLAQRCADAMFSRDRASQGLGHGDRQTSRPDSR
jgi:hypothetical protein